MKNFLLINLLLSLMLFSSCEKEKVKCYNADRYISFSRSQNDSLFYSFKLNPAKVKDEIPVEIELIGSLLDKDTEIKIEVDKEYANTDDDLYELPSKMVFHKNKAKDTIYIGVNKPSREIDSVRVVFRIVENEHFLPGLIENCLFKLIVNDKLSNPEWWDSTIKSEFLGKYSDKKFSLFIEVTGVSNLSDKTESEKRALSLKFKYYLQKQKEEGNTILDENGKPMVVTVVG